ncbi:unnamed protein product [Fraxinus pennsylvanica]|uniref:B-block binding subunit of TFIIIC domain-containing protein n=1 Tax=Fraxinus pennsylvanica TaxID=56036 RepID=A0AAD2DIV3_9LAMI|nr:unnamed protein product [Fraxinus pennsylvanica]
MDSIVHSALEEICSQGTNGLPIQNLWSKLVPSLSSQGLSLCPDVKRALWVKFLDIPGLHFETGVKVSCKSKEDLMKHSVEEWEQMNLKVVAPESLRNHFIGIYDIKASDSGISQPQRRALELLAIARTNGITQSELAKELGMKGNKIFYVLKKLEAQGLIVRQSTLIRTKESSNEGEPKSGSTVTTNMLYLYRYATHLGSQQRLEIIKEDKPLVSGEVADGNAATGDVFGEGTAKEVVHVKDFLPALKAICDKLEKAEGKVLVVSDIKRDLGYRGTQGHRAWRNICHRLKDACIVEECCTVVNKKEVNCLRLIKKFSPSYFEPKSHGHGHDDIDMEQPTNVGKRGQATEQLVESPILRQVYDIIDAEGSKGLTITEVCKRLGIRNKLYYNRLLNMFSRFGMHLQAESHNRGVGYRVWTAGNFNPEASNVVPSEPGIALLESMECNQRVFDLNSHESSAQSIQMVGASTSNDDVRGIDENEWTTEEPESSNCTKVDAEGRNMLLCPINSQNSETVTSNGFPEDELQIVSKAIANTAVDMCPAVSTPPTRRRSQPRYPCLTLGAASSQREQRILKMLQEEKFLIKPELHRRLESLEKEKNTMMDRKTLERSLNKLQREGHCKCTHVSVPAVTNCGRSKTTEVVLHPSVYNVSPELVGQIHDRMRSFELQVRNQSNSRQKKGQPITILDSVQRIPNTLKLDVQAERAKVMRSNGFVLAKMVRTKLLHIFLWGCVSSSPGWDDALLSSKHATDLKNPHSTCRWFELDKAIKFMPLELFLQVVGSTEKFEDLIEKCRNGLRLSDLPVQECKCLMDTRATGRLSWLIDILRRLKLIRLLSKGNEEDSSSGSHTTLTHALELKPYIEEPISTVALSSDFLFPDLRPQVRHDFVLSSRKAVDEYWNTLEYCYATAKSQAALHAFPGSAVHEVFHSRSWASVRVMTAEQRAELIKRVTRDEPIKKLSFRECRKIAKDLNLTLDQVLRVYYDKRQQCLTRLQGVSNAEVEDFHSSKSKGVSSSRKRKKHSERKSSEFVKANIIDGQSSDKRITTQLDSDDLFTEEQISVLTSSEDYEYHLQICHTGDNIESIGEPELNEVDEDARSFIHKCALSRLKPARRKKFLWTEEVDRQLVIEYSRYRASLGAKFHRVDWASISSLPAPPDSCRRRMAILNSYIPFRKAVMKLCNILAERYARYLEQVQGKIMNHADSDVMDQDYAFEEENMCFSAPKFGPCWDNFDDNSIKLALEDVLQYKRLAKLEASKHISSDQENRVGKDPHGTGFTSSASRSQEFENCEERSKACAQRSSSQLLPRKYVKLINEGASVSRRAHESVAIANAAELFKLIFLSTSSAPEVATLLAETLRRYSEHDLFAAFSYLRDKRIMIGGSCNSPFVLSQHFLQSISLSPFPRNTGKRAANFANWLQERETDLMEEEIDLPVDLQCGEIFHLCALVFSGEISITPCLPEEGVGGAEDTRTSKRKHDTTEIYGDDMPKKSRSSLAGEGEIISRREKGFPGIKLQLHRATISRINVIESYNKDEDFNFVILGKDTPINTSSLEVDCNVLHSDVVDHARVILDSGRTILPAYDVSKSPWEAMTSYSEYLISSRPYQDISLPLHPEVFKTLYSAIQKSGDQGLSMKEISKVLNMHGKMLEIMIEVLEAFRRAIKVNAYDDIRVVDSLYRSKYFLTPVAAIYHDHARTPPRDRKRKMDEELMSIDCNNHIDDVAYRSEIDMNANKEHRVTILNLPEDVADLSTEIQSKDKITGYELSEVIPPTMEGEVEMCRLHSVDYQICRPILLWMNGDGTVNELVYKGLVRRVLGIVMQNPGILEDDIINKMQALNPQSCRKLIEIMIMDNHIISRKMHQMTSAQTPSILSDLLGCRFKRPKSICREHFYANPMSTSLLELNLFIHGGRTYSYDHVISGGNRPGQHRYAHATMSPWVEPR